MVSKKNLRKLVLGVLIFLLIFVNIALRTVEFAEGEEFLGWVVFCMVVNLGAVIVLVLLALLVMWAVILLGIRGFSRDKIKEDISGE